MLFTNFTFFKPSEDVDIQRRKENMKVKVTSFYFSMFKKADHRHVVTSEASNWFSEVEHGHRKTWRTFKDFTFSSSLTSSLGSGSKLTEEGKRWFWLWNLTDLQ